MLLIYVPTSFYTQCSFYLYLCNLFDIKHNVIIMVHIPTAHASIISKDYLKHSLYSLYNILLQIYKVKDVNNVLVLYFSQKFAQGNCKLFKSMLFQSNILYLKMQQRAAKHRPPFLHCYEYEIMCT